MRKIQRFAALGAMAALTVALTACGSSATAPTTTTAPSSAPAAAATSAPAAAGSTDGVTKTTDTFGPACSALPQGDAPGSLNNMGPNPVATAASSNPLLKTLVTAVGAVPGLATTLNQLPAATVFAPYDPAFAEVQKALGAEKFGALLKNPTGLGALLQYHVSSTRMDGAGLIAAGKSSELAGGDLTIGGSIADGMTVTDGSGNTAKVLCGNIPTSNATVFVIDKVLMPKA